MSNRKYSLPRQIELVEQEFRRHWLAELLGEPITREITPSFISDPSTQGLNGGITQGLSQDIIQFLEDDLGVSLSEPSAEFIKDLKNEGIQRLKSFDYPREGSQTPLPETQAYLREAGLLVKTETLKRLKGDNVRLAVDWLAEKADRHTDAIAQQGELADALDKDPAAITRVAEEMEDLNIGTRVSQWHDNGKNLVLFKPHARFHKDFRRTFPTPPAASTGAQWMMLRIVEDARRPVSLIDDPLEVLFSVPILRQLPTQDVRVDVLQGGEAHGYLEIIYRAEDPRPLEFEPFKREVEHKAQQYLRRILYDRENGFIAGHEVIRNPIRQGKHYLDQFRCDCRTAWCCHFIVPQLIELRDLWAHLCEYGYKPRG